MGPKAKVYQMFAVIKERKLFNLLLALVCTEH